jgi:GTP cyclohydrolase I
LGLHIGTTLRRRADDPHGLGSAARRVIGAGCEILHAPAIQDSVRDILLALGEDPSREGLRRTPERVAKAWKELTAGYAVDVDKQIGRASWRERGTKQQKN